MSYKSPPYTISICQIAAMGTVYKRDTTLPEEIEISMIADFVLEVSKIYADPAVGNTLKIKTRINSDSTLPLGSIKSTVTE